MLRIFSHSLRRNRAVLAFLDEERREAGETPLNGKNSAGGNDPEESDRSGQQTGTDIVVGWGHKPTADRARQYAAEHGLTYIVLEDGFLRSLDLGANGAMPLSIVVDRSGIYYDATGPSDLENILNSTGWENPELLRQAERVMQAIVRQDLSKYNHAPAATTNLWPDDLWKKGESPVLVLDQTVGDASVRLGMADADRFRTMLDTALYEHSRESVLVKTHPDVIAGKKQGYLTEYAQERGARVLGVDCSPLSLLRQCSHVYTVTSQMGFEALFLNRRVHCFGVPFYAGWGLTEDFLPCPRRTRRRTLPELFAAACILYPRYRNPFREERCSVDEIVEILAEQRKQNEKNRTTHVCLGFPLWKRAYARAFLSSTGGDIAFVGRSAEKAQEEAIAAAQKARGRVTVWSSSEPEGLAERCRGAGVELERMEDGFIRSVGLGSDFNWPYSLVIDRRGIYYDPSRPSELEEILEGMPRRPDRAELCSRAARLRHFILQHRLTKYNTGSAKELPFSVPEGKKCLLVPGQVEDDASVRRGGAGWGNLDLLRAVRETCPEAFIIYKPHPDVASGNRKGRIPEQEQKRLADAVLTDFPMASLLELVDEVHTLTSQTGFEALLRNIPVYTYGGPFYAGWGLTHDRLSFPRRTSRLSLDELAAGTLLLYPAYHDWQTGLACRAEDVCARLLQPDGQMRMRLWARVLTGLRTLLRRIAP